MVRVLLLRWLRVSTRCWLSSNVNGHPAHGTVGKYTSHNSTWILMRNVPKTAFSRHVHTPRCLCAPTILEVQPISEVQHKLAFNQSFALRQLQIGLMAGGQEPARPAGLDVPNPSFPEYSTLESRLNSFVGWPTAVVGVTAQTLSEFGFFYIGSADRVRCFQCGITLRNWEPGDDPLSEHMNWSPDCAFITALVLRAGGEAGFHDVQAPGGDIGEDVSSARPEDRALDVERLGVTVNVAAGDRSVDISTAGSQRTDTNASESAQSVSSSPATSQSHSESAAPTAISSNPAEMRDTSVRGEQERTPTVQAVLDMGYSLDVVNRIREAKRQRDGADFTDATSLLLAIFDDENQTAMSDSASSSNPSPTRTTTQPGLGDTMSLPSRHPPPVLPSAQAIPTASSQTSSLSDSASPHPSHSSDDTSAQPQTPSAGASAQPDPPEASASAQPRLLRTTRPRQCQLCGQAEINVTFLPCGHLISCRSCAPKCSTCPKCNRTILGTVKTYFA